MVAYKNVSVEVKDKKGRWVTVVITVEEVKRQGGVAVSVTLAVGDVRIQYCTAPSQKIKEKWREPRYPLVDSEQSTRMSVAQFNAVNIVAFGILVPAKEPVTIPTPERGECRNLFGEVERDTKPVSRLPRRPRKKRTKDVPGQGALFA